METPLFFRNAGYTLFGVCHTPDNDVCGIGLVFCHPFGEEKQISHRVWVNLARGLTQAGFPCLRFDVMGHGDSEGSFEEMTVQTQVSDIECAVKYLRCQLRVERIGLIGVRFGGTLAALASSLDSGIDVSVMISPVIDGMSYIEQCLRSNLTTQLTTYGKVIRDRKQLLSELMAGHPVNIDGYLLSRTLYEQISEINLDNIAMRQDMRILIVDISTSEHQSLNTALIAFVRNLESAKVRVDVKQVSEQQFWKDGKMYVPRADNLQETIVTWLCGIFGNGRR